MNSATLHVGTLNVDNASDNGAWVEVSASCLVRLRYMVMVILYVSKILQASPSFLFFCTLFTAPNTCLTLDSVGSTVICWTRSSIILAWRRQPCTACLRASAVA